ncbi:hypothetical protein A7K91_12710 [Paenibacillus oryzae]|uniref:CN hydrolase domain-containing protein n=1 Tax=Paenibacillus oryzae TaxID=1844972 RepID=A0A1A5YFF6_9BACL|nr:nitrilase-related carbon-nitrogen hydrolase [Paenibacillus oryzae]OBR64361.1 hypothetical protein A7K91_12710 [Paenibacillus oryzae]
MREATLGLVQFESIIGDVAANARKAVRFIREAGEREVDLIIFPELFLTGYDLESLGPEYGRLAQDEGSDAVALLKEAVREAGVNAVLPMPLAMENGVSNGAYAINRKGDIVAAYSKVHLWDEESRYFAAGNEFKTVPFDFAKVGMMICYDAGFPESARTLTLQGADLMVVPSAFSKELRHRWDIYFATRALENTRFVAAVNGVGGISANEFLFGNNKVAAPNGEYVLQGANDREEMQVLTIDLNRNSEYERQIPYLRDRRSDIYGNYQNKSGKRDGDVCANFSNTGV